MHSFGSYLKDYLEYENISQTEFSKRLGISQKHMNEILNGNKGITLEMAGNIERLTNIPSNFIIAIETKKNLIDSINLKYGSEDNLKKIIKNDFCFKELKDKKWIKFKDLENIYQVAIDILDLLCVKDFDAHNNLEEYVLFKKKGNDYNKLALWIAYCDKLVSDQDIEIYDSSKLNDLVNELLIHSYSKGINLDNIKNILNKYGIYFICEKALSGTKVRGCFKVKGKAPAIYITGNYTSKDSLYFELFHEIGHLKSDYVMAQSKTIIDGDLVREKRADEFAYKTMISDNNWNDILDIFNKDNYEKDLLKYSKKNKICMSFIVGRLAFNNKIKYSSKFYNDYRDV